ncbi:DNA translocase FtsK [Oceanivirga salmonicida]|uniref:DNA translocase FtsK n=1 Tax=Oceanivirga salmonicida TaxID=1769291 RepID=UPI000AED41AA|nr:DNA translocase FtsK [Oceanivirga salmonicida]
MKKKISKMEKRIKERENTRFFEIIKAIILLVFSSIIIYISIFEEHFIVNKSTINELLYKLYTYTQLLFGSMLYVLIVTLLILSFSYFYKLKIGFKKGFTYLMFFVLMSSYKTISVVRTDNVNGMVESGRGLIENAFDGKGAGLVGALSSIPLYNFNNSIEYQYLILMLSIILLIIVFIRPIKMLHIIIKSTYNYYSSEEYIKKKQLLEAKRKIEEEERRRAERQKEENLKNMFVNISKEKLNTKLAEKPKTGLFDKTEYYSENDFEEKKKQWDEYVKHINRTKEEEALRKRQLELDKEIEEENKEEIISKKEIKIDNTKFNVEVEKKEVHIEKEVEPNIIKPVNEIKTENTGNNKILEREELKKSINEVFTYKKMDQVEKEEMLKYINENIEKLEKVLADYGVDAKVVDYATGPTITRYEITIPSGTRVKKVTSLADEISMCLSAHSVRFEAPIPGKNTIGIETPNKIKETVYFSNLIHSDELDKGDLGVVLGKDIIGKDKIIDIAKMPHLLIAGQTGSGKSVAINTIISTLISKKTDDEVKFILIDPKMVELMPYNGIPHLLVPVIINPEQAAIALKWAVVEMDERYKKLAEIGVRGIKQYNKLMPTSKMPYIVVIIDELADLMMVSANSVEVSIARIAQKARAVGIHLIVATQRPSTDVITGMIKANLPSRISFALRSQIDSRTIIDQPGAEKLLGMGDMLILENGQSKLERIQGAFISDDEVQNLTALLKTNKKVEYNMDILTPKDEEENLQDPLYQRAIELVDEAEDRVSINMLQINLKLGFNRAKNLFQSLKENGILDENGYKTNL